MKEIRIKCRARVLLNWVLQKPGGRTNQKQIPVILSIPWMWSFPKTGLEMWSLNT
jgi:hypothetical protein